MIKVTLAMMVAMPLTGLADEIVMTPRGNYMVGRSGNDTTLYGLSGQGITTIMDMGNGYAIMSPQGVTNVYGDSSTRPSVSVDPSNLDATPVIPGLQ